MFHLRCLWHVGVGVLSGAWGGLIIVAEPSEARPTEALRLDFAHPTAARVRFEGRPDRITAWRCLRISLSGRRARRLRWARRPSRRGLPMMGIRPHSGRATEWHALHNAYLADPTDERFQAFYTRIDELLEPVEPTGFPRGQERSELKYRSV